MKFRNSIILLLIILGLAVFFRFYQLNEIPPGLYPDVAINANDAISALKTGDPVKFLTSFGTTGQGFKVFYPENNGREGLFINLIALSFAIFGLSIWAIKVVPAVFGTLTVLGMYLMTRELFRHAELVSASQNQWINSNNEILKQVQDDSGAPFSHIRNKLIFHSEILALLSSFFLAISFWHVNFSRLGFRAIMVPFFLVWSFYFFFKARHYENSSRGRLGNWLLAGVFFGLGFHTYIAFRVAPLILVPVLLIEIIRYWPRFKLLIKEHLPLGKLLKQVYIKDGWWRWDVFFAVIILVALPIGIYFLQHPQDFLGRTGQVSVFSAENPVKELFISTIKTLGMFNFWGDCNWRHNYACSPMLLWPVGILFIIGLFITIKDALKPIWSPAFRQRLLSHPKGWTPIFLLTWFFVMLLPAILTIEGLPHALRSIGVIPVVYIFAGIGGWWVVEKVKNWGIKKWGPDFNQDKKTRLKSGLQILLVLSLFALAYAQYDKYFIDWAKQPDVKAAFTQNFVNIGNYLNNLPSEIQKYVIVNENGVPVPYPDGFPMPAQTIMFIQRTKNKEQRTIYLLPNQISSIINHQSSIPIVVVPMKYDRNLFKELRQKFPQGQIEAKEGFWAFKL